MALQQRYTSNEFREHIKAKGNILLSQALPWEAKNDIQQLIDHKSGDMRPELVQRLIQLNELETAINRRCSSAPFQLSLALAGSTPQYTAPYGGSYANPATTSFAAVGYSMNTQSPSSAFAPSAPSITAPQSIPFSSYQAASQDASIPPADQNWTYCINAYQAT